MSNVDDGTVGAESEDHLGASHDDEGGLEEAMGRAFLPFKGRLLSVTRVRTKLRDEYSQVAAKREVAWYTAFTLIFCAYSILVLEGGMGEPAVSAYFTNNFVNPTFAVGSNGMESSFRELNDETSFIAWLRTIVVGHWFDGRTVPERTNALMWQIRVRQLRVQPNIGCPKPIVADPVCGGSYDASTRSTDAFGPYATIAGVGLDNEQRTFVQRRYQWSSTSLTGMNTWFHPRLSGALYDGSGYLFDISHHLTRAEAEAAVDSLQGVNGDAEYPYIDRFTRAIFVHFSCFNRNLNHIGTAVFLVEFTSAGTIVSSHRTWSSKLVKDRRYPLYPAQMIVSILIMIGIIATCVHIMVQLRVQCASNIGTQSILFLLYDVAVIALMVYHLQAFLRHEVLLETQKRVLTFLTPHGEGSQYLELVPLQQEQRTLNVLNGFVAFLMTVRLVRFLGLVDPKFGTLWKVLFDRSFLGIAVWYAWLFFLILVGFLFCGICVFGSTDPDFRNAYRSVTTLCMMMLGDTRYTKLEEASHTAPIFVFTFVAVYFWFLLSLFTAIVFTSWAVQTAFVRPKDLSDPFNLLSQDTEIPALMDGYSRMLYRVRAACASVESGRRIPVAAAWCCIRFNSTTIPRFNMSFSRSHLFPHCTVLDREKTPLSVMRTLMLLAWWENDPLNALYPFFSAPRLVRVLISSLRQSQREKREAAGDTGESNVAVDGVLPSETQVIKVVLRLFKACESELVPEAVADVMKNMRRGKDGEMQSPKEMVSCAPQLAMELQDAVVALHNSFISEFNRSQRNQEILSGMESQAKSKVHTIVCAMHELRSKVA